MTETTGTRRRRARSGAQLVTIYWRDIPAQVTAQASERRAQALLPARFQKAIDKAARVAGLTDRHRYIEQWRRVAIPIDPDTPLDALVHDEAQRLDTLHDRQALAALVGNGGQHPDGATA
ncbi:MAG: virulence factor [Nitriliruptoraceae bacterium]